MKIKLFLRIGVVCTVILGCALAGSNAYATVIPILTSKGCTVEAKYSTQDILQFLEKAAGDATLCKKSGMQARDVYLAPNSADQPLFLGLSKPLVLNNPHAAPMSIHGPDDTAVGGPAVFVYKTSGFVGSCGIEMSGKITLHDLNVSKFDNTGVCLKTNAASVYDLWVQKNWIGVGTAQNVTGINIESSRFLENQYAISNSATGVFIDAQNVYLANVQRPIAHTQLAPATFSTPPVLENVLVPQAGGGDYSVRLKLALMKKSFTHFSLLAVNKTSSFQQAQTVPIPLDQVVKTEAETATTKTVELLIPVAKLKALLPDWQAVVANISYIENGISFTTEFTMPKAPKTITATKTGCDLTQVPPSDVPAWMMAVAKSSTQCLTEDKSRKVLFWNVPKGQESVVSIAAPITIENVGPPLEIWGSLPNVITTETPKVRFVPTAAFNGVGALEVKGGVRLANLDFSGFKNGAAAVAITGDAVQLQNLWARDGSFGVDVTAGAKNAQIAQSVFKNNDVAIHVSGDDAVIMASNQFYGNVKTVDLPQMAELKYPAPVLSIQSGVFVADQNITYKLRAAFSDDTNVPVAVHLWVSDVAADGSNVANATLLPIPAVAVQCQSGQTVDDLECQVNANAVATPTAWKSLVAMFEYADHHVSEMSTARVLKDGFGCDLSTLTASEALAKIQQAAQDNVSCLAFGEETQQLYWRPMVAGEVEIPLAKTLQLKNTGKPLVIWGSIPEHTVVKPSVHFTPAPGFSGVGLTLSGNDIALHNLYVGQFVGGLGVMVSGKHMTLDGLSISNNRKGIIVSDTADAVEIRNSHFTNNSSETLQFAAPHVVLHGNRFDGNAQLVTRASAHQALFPAPVVQAVKIENEGTPQAKLIVTAPSDPTKTIQSVEAVVTNATDTIKNAKIVPVQVESCTYTDGIRCEISNLQVGLAMPDPKSIALAVTYADALDPSAGATSEFSALHVPGFVAAALATGEEPNDVIADDNVGNDDGGTSDDGTDGTITDSNDDDGNNDDDGQDVIAGDDSNPLTGGDTTPEAPQVAGNGETPDQVDAPAWLIDKVKALLEAGASVEDLVAAGVEIDALVAAGVPAQDLLEAGITADLLLAHGASVADLLAAGVSESTLVAAGVPSKDIEDAKAMLPIFDPGLEVKDPSDQNADADHTGLNDLQDNPDASNGAGSGGGCSVILP